MNKIEIALKQDLDATNNQLSQTKTELQQTQQRLSLAEDSNRNLAKAMQTIQSDVNISTYAPITSISANAREGVGSLSVKGRSLKNELVYNRDTWAEWTKTANVVTDTTGIEFTANGSATYTTIPVSIKPLTKYGILFNIVSNSLDKEFYMSESFTGVPVALSTVQTGYRKITVTSQQAISINTFGIRPSTGNAIGAKIKLRDIRIFELPTGSQIESDFNTLTADQLAEKYPYVQGQRDTVSGRVKSTGKNLFVANTSNRMYGNAAMTKTTTGIIIKGSPVNSVSYVSVPYKLKPKTQYNLSAVVNIISGEGRVAIRYSDGSAITALFSSGNISFITDDTGSGSIYFYCKSTADTGNYEVRYSDIMINEGTVAPYQPYIESLAYLPRIGKRLLNNVADSLDLMTGECVQRVNQYILQANDIINVTSSDHTNVNMAKTRVFTDNAVWINDINRNIEISGMEQIAYANRDDISNVGKYCAVNNQTLWFPLPRNTTLEQARTQLAGLKLTYQLAEPITTNTIPQPIKINPSGTLQWEYIKGEIEYPYSDKVSVTDTTLPIKSIVRLVKVNKSNGTETPLNISQAVISADKLSFTHPSLAKGDIVDWDYEYDSSFSAMPEISFSYNNGYTGTYNPLTHRLIIKGGIITGIEPI